MVSNSEDTIYIQGTYRYLHQASKFSVKAGINIIGRKADSTSTAKIEIETNDKLMSREHLKIEVVKYSNDEYNYLLSDNVSKNQTRHNNHYLDKGEIIVLRNQDEIKIGNTKIQFNK